MSAFSPKDSDDFEKVKAKAEAFYATVGSIKCPYFNDIVTFNAKGIRHLKFKSDQQARSQEDQYARLKLLQLAPEVLKLSRTVQGICHIKRFESQKTNNRWDQVLKEVSYYEFLAVMSGLRLKVIVKQVAGGERHFWSVIPFWKIDKKQSRRVLYSGTPEVD